MRMGLVSVRVCVPSLTRDDDDSDNDGDNLAAGIVTCSFQILPVGLPSSSE